MILNDSIGIKKNEPTVIEGYLPQTAKIIFPKLISNYQDPPQSHKPNKILYRINNYYVHPSIYSCNNNRINYPNSLLGTPTI